MPLVTVYDPLGNAVQKESVDARECVEHCGFTYDKQEPVLGDAAQDLSLDMATDHEGGEPVKLIPVDKKVPAKKAKG